MLLSIALAALFQGTPAAAPRPAPQDTSAAYVDASTRELVRGGRERRARVERTIDAYSVTARERIHVGVEAMMRDRTLFGQETALRVDWRRGQPGTIRVLGARQASPATSGSRVDLPGDLREDGPSAAFHPDRLQLNVFGFSIGVQRDTADRDSAQRARAEARRAAGEEDEADITVTSQEPIDPLTEGSEAHYRFRTGDTTSVRLPDGTRLQMVELRVLPRRREFRLLRGSLWIDTQTHGVVRSVLTTARPFDLQQDVDEDMPGIVNIAGRIQAQVRYITVEYALWQGKFWLPRLMAMDMEANIGALAGVPVRFERSYDDYQVTASPTPATVARVAVAERDTVAERVCRADAKAITGGVCDCGSSGCQVWTVEIPADTAALLNSPDLPEPLTQGGGRLITGEEVESLARVLTVTMGAARPQLETELPGLRTLRYNRVEGLSVGARAAVTYGAYVADGMARIGFADLEPNAELGIARQTTFWRTRLAGYRRLTPFDREARGLELGNSLSALLLGRDEADYFLATGAEITGTPLRRGAWTYDWRLFGEHQHPSTKNTDLSLASAWDDDVFREVRPAARADQLGLGLNVHRAFGSDRAPAQLLTRVALEGQTGSFEFGRGSVFARLSTPFSGRVALALEGAAGSTMGDVPLQGLWYLGGPHSVRGYRGALVGGASFWRGRAELATPTPAARLVLFGDAGWVGGRDAWRLDPRLLSAGVGASLLDGLIRLDLSRALRGPTGWRVDLYLDAAL